jgi:hypothetical protein
MAEIPRQRPEPAPLIKGAGLDEILRKLTSPGGDSQTAAALAQAVTVIGRVLEFLESEVQFWRDRALAHEEAIEDYRQQLADYEGEDAVDENPD